MPAHAALEAYSVLTRFPAPHRASAADVREFLRQSFDDNWLTLRGTAVAQLVDELATRGVHGGATYDGLIGLTARAAGLKLVTRDLRARKTYELLGVEVEFVG